MFWSCERCNAWGEAGSEVDLAVDRQTHLNSHREQELAEAPQTPPEDTALNAKYAAWGVTLGLGLLSLHWESLAVVVPFAALIAWVLTYRE